MSRYINIAFIKKYHFFILLGLLMLLFFVINFFFTIRFESNDDVVMALISSGGYSGSLDNHLVFINMLYGSFLNFFYYLFPAYEWYPIFFVALNIISVTLISWQLLKTNNDKVVKSIFLLFLFLVFLQITIQLQFTKTAAIVSIAGVVLLYQSKSRIRYLGSILIVLGSLIRFEAAFLVLLITMPIFFLDYFKDRKFYLDSRKKVLAVSIAICCMCKLVDYVYYSQNPEWEYFLKYNKLRGSINDNPNASGVFNNLPDEISRPDYDALLSFFPDPQVMGYEAVKKINSELDKVPPFTKMRYVFRLRYYFFPILLLVIIALSARYTKKRNSSPTIGIILMFGLLAGALIFTSFNGTVKDRVFFVAVISFILVLPYLLANIPSSIQKKIMLLSVFLFTYYFYEKTNKTVKNENYAFQVQENQSKIIADYLSNDSKKLIPYSGNYRLEYMDPFAVSAGFYTDKIYLGGWFTNIPFHKDKFQSFKALIDNYGVLINENYYKKAVWQITNSILVNQKIKVVPKVVLNYKGNYIVEFRTAQN